MAELYVGCSVRLRGGGPTMTVIGGKSDTSRCAWVDAQGTPHEQEYPDSALTVISYPRSDSYYDYDDE